MKKIYFFIITLLVSLTMNAGEVTEQQALQKAQQFMKGKQFKQVNLRRATAITEGNAFYVFNVENNGGFVIVSGDDRIPCILAYSEKGILNPEKVPSNVKWMLDYYKKVFLQLKNNPQATQTTSRAPLVSVGPLITTTWDQSTPYNDLCPVYGSERCLTGCVATALAQVINYNRWPLESTNIVPAYTSSSLKIEMPQLEATQFKWDNMTNNDIARLMLYCGQAVQMDYGVNESGAFPYMEVVALTSVFGYSQSTHQVSRNSYNEEEWESLLHQELVEGRPIVYDGHGSGGGHCFVVHGYDNGMFYINWGWGGNEDGFFRITGLETGLGDFNSEQSATIGIQPPTGNVPNRPQIIVKGVNCGGSRFVSSDNNGTFSTNVEIRLTSDLSESEALGIGLGLYDSDGLQKVLYENTHTFTKGEEYVMNATLSVSSDISDGTYRVVPICKSSASDGWLADNNSSDYYFEIKIDGQWMRLRSFQLDAFERTIEDVGITTVEGISYALYKQYNKERSSVLGVANGKIQGDIIIPDKITFNGKTYHVSRTEYDAFTDCPDLTSLSIGATTIYGISNCPKLAKLELREGVCNLTNAINGCNSIEEIEFPSTLTTIEHSAEWCDKIESLRFNNVHGIRFMFYPQWQASSLPSLKDVYFASIEAAAITFKTDNFAVNPQVKVHVPIGGKSVYEAEGWQGWNIVEDITLPDIKGIEWGYCNGWEVSEASIYDNCGNNDGEYAIHVPAEQLAPYLGMTISHIQFYQPTEACDYVFITKPGTDYIVKQNAPVLEGAWMNVELAQPYVITGEEIYVGIGCRGSVVTHFSNTDTKVSDGLWYRVIGEDKSLQMEPGKWKYVPDQSEVFEHPIPLRFIITGEEKPADIAILDVSIKALEGAGNHYNIKVCANNRSQAVINSFVLSWNIDDEHKGEKTIECLLKPGYSSTFDIDITASLLGRYHKLNYQVLTVDDIADYVKANSTGTISFASTDSPIDDGQQIVNNVEIKDGQVWWSNHDKDENAEISCVGNQRVGVRYHAAIYIPRQMIGGKGTTIDGFSFYRNTLASQNFTLWVSSHLPKSELDADIEIIDVPNSQLATEMFKYHQVAFQKSHEIPEEGLYVGYSFDITADMMNAGYPCQFSNSVKNREGGFWMKASNHPEWSDMTTEYGNLWAEVLIGGNLHQNAVRISDFSYASTVIGETAKTNVVLYNDGANSVNQIGVKISGNKGIEYERIVNVSLQPYSLANAVIEIDADATQGNDQKTITVVKVNNQENELSEGISTTGTLYTLIEKPKTTAVFENKTSTMSGGGAMSMTIREKLSEDFGDKLIVVAFHEMDIMTLKEFQELSKKSYSLEAGFVNRCKRDIYRGSYHVAWGIKKDIQDVFERVAPGSVSIRASWADDDMNVVNIQTDTRFMMDADTHPFRLGYILLEDGLTGTGSSWAQANQLSGYNYEEDPLFDYWASQPNPIEGLTFNQVPVAAWNPIFGVDNSIPKEVKAGVVNSNEFKADIANNRLIQNKSNLSVVVLIVDKDSGKIINAAKCKIGESSTNIEISPISDTKETSFKETIGNQVDLKNTVIDNTYYNMDAENGDGYDAEEQALVLNSTTTTEQMTAIQNVEVGDAAVRENYNGIIFEVPAGQGTITVDAKTVGTHVLNVQIGNSAPTKITMTERGTADVEYHVSAPTYVYLYASTSDGSAARLDRAPSATANSILLYGYKVTFGAGVILGDANGDGVVNVTDIVEIVNAILGHPSAKFNEEAADVNVDGQVNVTDIVSVVNIILSDPVAARELLGDEDE